MTDEEDNGLPEAEGWEVFVGVFILVVVVVLSLIWPVAIARAILAGLSWVSRDWEFTGPAAVMLTGSGIWLLWRQRAAGWERGKVTQRAAGIPVRWGSSRISRWRSCRYCTGGMQWHDAATGKWGKIPVEIRLTVADGVNMRLANVRNCPWCRGVGHHWRREKAG